MVLGTGETDAVASYDGAGRAEFRFCTTAEAAVTAIYSLNLKSIRCITHAAGTAGAHVLYIVRPDARAMRVSAHMPTGANPAGAFLDRGELADRKYARVADKVRTA